ncbi:MAG TPA: APC family permease [Planctomycetota bacterium]
MSSPAAPGTERSATTPGASAPEPLARELSRVALLALAINGMVGAGIFGLPGKAFALTGAFSPFLFVLGGLLMTALMATFAQLASWFSGTGGPVAYVTAAFGPFAGFQTGWCLYTGRVVSLAANTNLLATYAGAGDGVLRVVVIAVVTLGFGALNVHGVRTGAQSLLALTLVKFAPLLLFALAGLAFVSPEPFATLQMPALGEFGPALLLVFYAFIGFEGALVPAGEARDPRRDLPRVLLITAAFTTLLYAAIQVVCISALPGLATSERPLADAAAAMARQVAGEQAGSGATTQIGTIAILVVSAAAILSVLGNTAAATLSAPRMTYALAREGSLPAVFGAVHARTQTPHVSIWLYCGLGFVLGASGSFAELAVISTLARLLGYIASVAAVPVLRRRFPAATGLRLPGGLLIPAVAFVLCCWLAVQVDFATVWRTAVLIGAGTVLFVGTRLWRSRRSR